MCVGDIVKVERSSYDYNGEVWRWQEIAIIVREDEVCYLLYTPHNEKFKIEKSILKYINYQILSHAKMTLN